MNHWQRGHYKIIQLATERRAVVYTTFEGIVWLRIETLDNQQCTTAFTCVFTPDMASDIAGTLENAQPGVSETHIGSGTEIKINWTRQIRFAFKRANNWQSKLLGVLDVKTAAARGDSVFVEEAGQRFAAALRWVAGKSSNNMPSVDDSIEAADRKRDDLMKGMFS